MGNFILSVLRHNSLERWQRWDEELDRLEKFAAAFGGSYVEQLDPGFIALASALFGLCALAW